MPRAVLAVLLSALAALVAACGQAGSSGEDPTALVPARASVYVEATVRPEGGTREDALASAGKLLRTDDPEGRLQELFDKALAESSPGVTWEKDFAPWLGEKAGFWLANLERDEPTGAAIIAVTDEDKAKETFARLAKAEKTKLTEREYEGVAYQVEQDDDKIAYGIVDGWAVFGPEAGFKQTVDAREGAKLGDAKRYEDDVAELAEGRLGHYWVDTRRLLDAAAADDPSFKAQADQLTRALGLDKLGPMSGAFLADAGGMSLDSNLTVPDGPLRRLYGLFAGGRSEAFRELPGESWGAFGAPEIGQSLQTVFNAFAGALGGAAVQGQLQAQLGLDLERDVFSWMGDLGAWVRGTDAASLDGGVVVKTTDDAKAATAFGKLVGLLRQQTGTDAQPIQVPGAESAFAISQPGMPKPIVLARGAGRVVAAYGEAAAAESLSPKTKLADAEAYSAAKERLGDGMEPSFLLSMPPVLALVEAMGGADADYAKAKPYLETIAALVSGGSVEGDKVRSRFAVTFK